MIKKNIQLGRNKLVMGLLYLSQPCQPCPHTPSSWLPGFPAPIWGKCRVPRLDYRQVVIYLGLSISWLELQQGSDKPQSCCILLQPGVPYREVVQVVSLVRFLSVLEQVLQQNYAFPDVCRVARPHKAPSIFKLGPRAHLA